MPNTAATFSEALNYAFLQVDPIHGSLKCESKLIGDMAPGFKKQCFCEKKMPRKPIYCAKEGENCECPAGNKVFYGAESTLKSVNATFDEMVDECPGYSYGFSPVKESMKCGNGNFNDPLPGQSKKNASVMLIIIISKSGSMKISESVPLRKRKKRRRPKLKSLRIRERPSKRKLRDS